MHLKHGYCMLIHFIHGYYCIYRPWQALAYIYFPNCILLIYFSFTKICMFLYARMYCLAEFGDVSCLQFSYLRVETLTPTWEDLVGHLSDNLVGHLSVWSPTKLSVRPECLIVDTLGGICILCNLVHVNKKKMSDVKIRMKTHKLTLHCRNNDILFLKDTWHDFLFH